GLADGAAAGRVEIAPDALAGQALSRRWHLSGDLGPVAFKLLGHQLREAGLRALAHLGAGNANDDGIVRADDHPGVHLLRTVGRAHDARAAERQIKTERKAAANGGCGDQEGAAVDFWNGIHEIVSALKMHWPRHGWLRGPAERCRNGKYW